MSATKQTQERELLAFVADKVQRKLGKRSVLSFMFWVRDDIVLCALDFGLSDGVNRAISDLVKRGVVGAVSCLPISDLWPQSARQLIDLRTRASSDVKIGVSVRLTGAFSPLTAGFAPENALKDGTLPDVADLAAAARVFALEDTLIEAEFRAQMRRFVSHTGFPPQFVALEDTILLFGPAACALSATLSKFDLQDLTILCPVVPRTKGLIRRLKQKWVWQSDLHLSEPWHRRQLSEPRFAKQLPPKSSWLHDGRNWAAIRPAYDDERLLRFDDDPEERVLQCGWFDAV